MQHLKKHKFIAVLLCMAILMTSLNLNNTFNATTISTDTATTPLASDSNYFNLNIGQFVSLNDASESNNASSIKINNMMYNIYIIILGGNL